MRRKKRAAGAWHRHRRERRPLRKRPSLDAQRLEPPCLLMTSCWLLDVEADADGRGRAKSSSALVEKTCSWIWYGRKDEDALYECFFTTLLGYRTLLVPKD